MNQVKQAEDFAKKAHGDQKYAGRDYFYHLNQVRDLALQFDQDLPEHLEIAAILHDVLEDTDTTLEDVESAFGEKVAVVVSYLTDKSGANRRERHLATYPALRTCAEAVFIKICDRIANVKNCIENNSSLLSMYRQEHEYFRQTLYVAGEYDAAWEYLDQLLAFPHS